MASQQLTGIVWKQNQYMVVDRAGKITKTRQESCYGSQILNMLIKWLVVLEMLVQKLTKQR